MPGSGYFVGPLGSWEPVVIGEKSRFTHNLGSECKRLFTPTEGTLNPYAFRFGAQRVLL